MMSKKLNCLVNFCTEYAAFTACPSTCHCVATLLMVPNTSW